MDPATLIGILVVLIGLLVGVLLEGGNPIAFLNIPAFFIVLVGTAGVTLASVRLTAFFRIPGLIVKAIKSERAIDDGEAATTIVRLAERARREGVLAIEDDVAEVPDPFLRKGLQMVVDGTDPEFVNDVLRAEIDGMAERHRRGYSMFNVAGGFAPTLGILGTVMGLVHVLEKLEDPGSLGPAIATAFIATLYGVGVANVFLLPVANKLKSLSEEEAGQRELIVEGILALQAGENPRVIGDKLAAYLPPAAAAAREPARNGEESDVVPLPEREAA